MSIVVETGNTVTVQYTAKFDDGTIFDTSRDREEPLQFTVGSQSVISGFDNAVVGMQVGETKSVVIGPENGYGQSNPDLVKTFSQDHFKDAEIAVGKTVIGIDDQGRQTMAQILQISDGDVVLDFNHPLAGKVLNFEIEVTGIV